MKYKVFLLQCFICTLCVFNNVNSELVHRDLRGKRYALNYHANRRHGPNAQIDELDQERFSAPPGRSDYRVQPYYEEPKMYKVASPRGPPDHRGSPENKGPPAHKGPPANKGGPNRGPPANRGPPDHKGPPNKVGDKETREPSPNIEFLTNPINDQLMGGQSVSLQNNANAINPQNDKKACNQAYTGNIAIYEYLGKPVFQVEPVTPES